MKQNLQIPLGVEAKAFDTATKEEKRAVRDLANRTLCQRVNGTTWREGGGMITCRPAGSLPPGGGLYEWRWKEIQCFWKAAEKRKADNFVCQDMPLYVHTGCQCLPPSMALGLRWMRSLYCPLPTARPPGIVVIRCCCSSRRTH